jgi:hypothetical protein
MNRIQMLAALVALAAAPALIANPDDAEQMPTPQELCESYAKEDGVAEEELAAYMQDCITSIEEMPAEGSESESLSEETTPASQE